MGPRTSIPEGATVLIAIILSREQPGLLGLITLRGLRLVPPQFRPALHRWRARGPPEDYGGPGAYGSLPPALADPINQEQAEHPEAFDPAAKNGALERAAAEVGTWLFPLLVCVVRAGLRIGEVLALRPEDLDLTTAGRETLRVARACTIDRTGTVVLDDPKTEAGRRTLRLSPAVITVLRRWLDVDRPAWKLKTGWRTLPPCISRSISGYSAKNPARASWRRSSAARSPRSWRMAASFEYRAARK